MSGLAAEIRNLILTVAGPSGLQTIADIPTLSIASGKMTALSGPSGSGKSTLLYLLAGLVTPQQGEVNWAGADIAQLSEGGRDGWRLKNCGFVFQSFNLIDELSATDNVLVPAWFANIGVRDLRKRAEGLLGQLGVPRQRDRVSLLSRGEQQRVAIARALLLDPKIVVADEPTASLDAASGQRVIDILSELANRERRTVVIASHDPAILERADAVLRIDHGRIGDRAFAA